MSIIISIYSLKGGTGKTTLSINLYDAFKRHGVKSIILVDTDPQKSVYSLVGQLEQLDINVTTDFGKVGDSQLVLVDSPPAIDNKEIDKILPLSDLILIPCRPSAPDALSLLTTITKVKEIQKDNEGVKAAIVVNGLLTGNTFANDVKAIIEAYGLPVLTTTIGQRMAFQKGLMSGSIYKEGNKIAINEIEHLMNEVFRIVSL